MVEYTLEHLLEDAAARHVRPSAAGQLAASAQRRQLAEVWETIDRYITACLERRQGVVLPNLFRVGWQAVKLRGRSTFRPYFQLSDSFCRTYGAVPARNPQFIQDEDVCPMEEFNFSKAAIRFSSRLSKDHVSSGLRALVNQLGQVVGQGRSVSIALSFGKLVSEEKEVRMAFGPEFYAAHGIEAPAAGVGPDTGAQTDRRRSGTVTFAATHADSAQGLSIAGNGFEGVAGGRAQSLGARVRGGQSGSVDAAAAADSSCGNELDEAPEVNGGACSSRSQLLRCAHQDAMHRQITALETRASEAIRDRAELEGEHHRGMAQDARAREQRQARRRENAEFLQQQIEANRSRKTAEKAASVAEDSEALSIISSKREKPPVMPHLDIAAMHRRNILTSQLKEDLAGELASAGRGGGGSQSARGASPSTEASQGRTGGGAQKEWREALDQQIQDNKVRREEMRRFEKRVEASLMAANSREASAQQQQEQAARAQEREILGAAWRQEAQIKDIRKTIEAIELGKNMGGKASVAGSSCGDRPLTERQLVSPWPFASDLDARPGSSRGGGSGCGISCGPMSARRTSEGAPRSARGEALGAAAMLTLQQKAVIAA